MECREEGSVFLVHQTKLAQSDRSAAMFSYASATVGTQESIKSNGVASIQVGNIVEQKCAYLGSSCFCLRSCNGLGGVCQ